MPTLRNCIFPTGERFPVLVDFDGLPVSLPTLYVVDRLRLVSKANTIAAHLRVINVLYNWASEHIPKIDLEVRLRSKQLLVFTEIMSFARYMRLREQFDVIPMAWPVRPGANCQYLANNTYRTYLDFVRDFLVWAAICYAKVGHEELNNYMRLIEAEKPRTTRIARLYSLTPDERLEFEQHIRPDSKTNPYNRPVRYRNFAIGRVLLETGIRRGELCKLRVEDIHTKGSESYIEVKRRPDDPIDPRASEPNVKTEERKIPILAELKSILVDYIKKHRGPVRNHPYLFIDPKSRAPFGVTAVNKLLTRAKMTSSNLAVAGLTPHTLRRTFEEHLSDLFEQSNLTPQQQKDARNYLSGWVPHSEQADVYTRLGTERDAFRIVKMSQHWKTAVADPSESKLPLIT